MSRRPSVALTAFLGFLALLSAEVCWCEPLSRQQLLEMKSAGIGEQVIIQQIEANGIAFQPNPSAMIALKKAGFSDLLLTAVMKAHSPEAPLTTIPAMDQPGASAVPKSQNGAGQVSSVDQCEIDKREDDRLETRIKMFSDACERVGEMRYPGQHGFLSDAGSFADNCTHYYACPLIKQEEQQKKKILHCEGVDGTDYHIGDCEDNFVPHTTPIPADALQVLQAGDSTMTCADLKVATGYLNVEVATLNGKIQAATGSEQTHDQMAALASAANAGSAATSGMQMLSSQDREKVARYQQYRDNFQKRHDYLMQIYFQKHCQE
jgi:hypothetical protein